MATCETGPFGTTDCNEAENQKTGITLVIWIVGFFLLSAIGNAGRGASGPGAQSPAPSKEDDPLGQVGKLAELRDQGAITEAEFDEKKAALLKRIE